MPQQFGTTGSQAWAAAPAVGPPGATYFNTTSKTLFCSDGTSWLPSGSGDASVVTGNGVGGTGLPADPVIALTSNTWGVGQLAKTGTDPTAGQGIYVDSAGQLRARPTELSANQLALDANSLPGDWPIGQMILQVTGATSATWPGGASGTVVTTRRPGEADNSASVHQVHYRTAASTAGYSVQYRSASGTPTVWGPWVPLFNDSGWVDVTVKAGFAVQGTEKPQVRMVGGVIYSRGGWNNTGITAGGTFSVGTVPAGYRPTQNVVHQAGTQGAGAVASMFISNVGDVQVRVGTPAPTYMMLNASWLTS